MIREVKFESQDRRIKQIIAALNANGIKDIEEANAICSCHFWHCFKISISGSSVSSGSNTSG